MRSRSRSPSATLPLATSVLVIQSTSGPQYSVPSRITGKRVILPVCTSVSASKSSSRVPMPPGSATKPWLYFTNMVLRAKK